MPSPSKILIADGCVMTRELIGLLLRAKKHTVIYANNARDAVELIRLHKPTVVIHEMDLIDSTGAAFVQSVRGKTGTHAPSFFVLTALTDKSRLLEIIELGVTQVLIKHQFSIKIFYSKVESLIKSRRACTAKPCPTVAEPTETTPTAPHTQSPSQAPSQTPSQTPSQAPNQNHGQAPPQTPAGVPTPAAGTPSADQLNRENQTHQTPAHAPEPIVLRTPEQKKALYLALKPVMTKTEALERAEGVAELKALSPTAARVISLTGSAEASLDAIAKAIRNDHAITLKIIRVANSTAFTRGEPVSTLNDAVLRIGVQQIRQAVINLEIMENFSSDTADFIDHRLFWEHSIGVAACCSMIARERRSMDPNEAFTVGLLHDVGRMILNQAFGKDYTEALRFARENQFPLDQIERRMFLVDHASIMNNILHKWGVHKDLIQPIVNHHLSVGNIRQTCPKHIETASMVALANRIVHAIRIGCSGNETVYASEEYFEAIKLPPTLLATLCDKLPESVVDMRLAMLGEMGINGFPEPKPVCENMGVRPLYITANETTDCIQHWVASIRRFEDPDAKPNLAVVRMRKKREDIWLDDQLRKAEAEYGIEPLPLIVLSETGKLMLPVSARYNRETRLLPIPFTRQEFERSVQSLPGFDGILPDAREAA